MSALIVPLTATSTLILRTSETAADHYVCFYILLDELQQRLLWITKDLLQKGFSQISEQVVHERQNENKLRNVTVTKGSTLGSPYCAIRSVTGSRTFGLLLTRLLI